MVGTHGKIEGATSGRKVMDLSSLKCLVMDESDVFFLDEKNYETIRRIVESKSLKDHPGYQWVLFSATFPAGGEASFEEVQKRISAFVKKSVEIKVKPEKLKLPHIQQFKMRCEPKKKLDFIKSVFETCEMT